jgi:hypothetical protein
MRNAQQEAAESPRLDLTILVLHGLCRYAVSAVDAVSLESPTSIDINTAQVVEEAKAVAEAFEADIDADAITARRVGRVMSTLRFVHIRDAKLKGWRVDLRHLANLARAHGVPFGDAHEDETEAGGQPHHQAPGVGGARPDGHAVHHHHTAPPNLTAQTAQTA